MDIFLLYLWTRLDSIQTTFAILMVSGGMAMTVLAVAWGVNSEYEGDKPKAIALKAYLIKIAKYMVAVVIASVIIPSQKDAAIIAGGWAAKQIATSDKAQQISTKTFDLINGKLDEELSKLKKDSK